jgi:hypothetical protein
MQQFKTYVLVLSACILVPMIFVFSLNLFLLRQPHDPHRFLRASEWQERTHGITMVLLGRKHSGPFKTLRLHDRLPDINAVVFGSSTAMSIQIEMFPPGIRIYNFSQPANPLSATIGQIEYILNYHENIRWMFVPLDWAIGFLYFSEKAASVDLSRTHTLDLIHSTDEPLPWSSAIADALTFQVIKGQLLTLLRVLRSQNKIANFSSAFLMREGNEYICEQGLARDYEPDQRGECFGFQYDGSLNFHRHPSRPRAIMVDSLGVHSFVRNVLPVTKGVPNEAFMNQLAEQARRLQERGGRMIFFMPPLFPGLEQAVLRQPDVGDYLQQTKNFILQWADKNGLVAFDFGPSERFGCLPAEFEDGPHALGPCYRKLFQAIWRKDSLVNRK